MTRLSGGCLRRRRLAVAPGADVGEAGDRGHRGATAGRDDDGPARDEHVVLDADAPLAVEPAVAADERDAALLEPGQLR